MNRDVFVQKKKYYKAQLLTHPFLATGGGGVYPVSIVSREKK